MDPLIEEPRLGVNAFLDDSEVGYWSLAAQLVGMVVRMRGVDRDDEEEQRSLDDLLVPRLMPIDRMSRSQRSELDDTRWIGYYPDFRYRSTGIPGSLPFNLEAVYGRGLIDREARGEASLAALSLLATCLRHPAEIVRVVAAAGLVEFVEDGVADAEAVLAEGCRSNSETVQVLAADALARSNPDHPAIRALLRSNDGNEPSQPMNTSLCVHGTWARHRSSWWRPGTAFHDYIRTNVASDLYNGDDHFRWTGGYSGGARAAAAHDLGTWLAQHDVDELNFAFAHSHGGNVVLDAASTGMASAALLVLLHVPAIERTAATWTSIQGQIRRIVCLRTRFDFVVALDGSGHRFGPQVRDLTVPGVWFSHDAMLNPKVWKKHNLPRELAYERGIAEGGKLAAAAYVGQDQ